mmetsp:Transcript_13003/g.47516  ORF Transcript_13003/g.47516 Transcript_13003/m.47516 type:complete len:377 (+) Transcript_13003:2021-3151(+)
MRPRPLPLCAPSIKPGRSASFILFDSMASCSFSFSSSIFSHSASSSSGTSLRSGTWESASLTSPSSGITKPRFGINVVNGYGAISGRARVSACNRDDFPAFGNPTSPTSATTRRISCRVHSSPSCPFASSLASSGPMSPSVTSDQSSALPPFRLLEPRRFFSFSARERSRVLAPPRPPRATSTSSPTSTRSASRDIRRLLRNRTVVPGGTRIRTSKRALLVSASISSASLALAPPPPRRVRVFFLFWLFLRSLPLRLSDCFAALPMSTDSPRLAAQVFLLCKASSVSCFSSATMYTSPPSVPLGSSAAPETESGGNTAPSPPLPPCTLIITSSKKRCFSFSRRSCGTPCLGLSCERCSAFASNRELASESVGGEEA